MKTCIFLLACLSMTFLSNIRLQANPQTGHGEGWRTITLNQNNFGHESVFTYYQDGYYEGYRLNFNDIVRFYEPPSGGMLRAAFTVYGIDGNQVALFAGPPENYFVTIQTNTNFQLQIVTVEQGPHGPQIDGDFSVTIKAIPWNFSPPTQICLTAPPLSLRQFIRTTAGAFTSGNFPHGTLTGIGVANDVFNPQVAGLGSHIVSFQYGERNVTRAINVVAPQNVSVNFPSFIHNTNSVGGVTGRMDLRSHVNPTGGTFRVVRHYQGQTQPLIDGRFLDLLRIIPEDNFITPEETVSIFYEHTSGPCTQTFSSVVTIRNNNIDVRMSEFNDLCANGQEHDLRVLGSVSPPGGTFTASGGLRLTGEGNSLFVADRPGYHEITYTVTRNGYSRSQSRWLRIHELPALSFAPIPPICRNIKINLNNHVSIPGGVFSGPGVVGHEFFPSIAGIGNHVITYSFTNSHGCISTVQQTINIVELFDLNLDLKPFPVVCQNGNTLFLPDFVNHSGGVFSGRGVTANFFNPSVAGEGIHVITYRITQGTCVMDLQGTIQVFAPDEIVFSTIPNLCFDTPINLFNYVSPQGGSFSGQGVIDGVFHPANVGIGQYTISYEHVNANGCRSVSTRVIRVINLLNSNIVFSSLPQVCPESSVINLRDYINSVEGEFFGRGVTDGFFNPSVAGPGVHRIEFRLINGACRIEKFQSIIVKRPTPITFLNLPVICHPGVIDLSSFVVPKGGQFAGNGVSGHLFDPSVAGVGTHEITYLLNDNSGCVNQVKQVVTVTNLVPRDLSFNRMPDVCTNSQSVRLTSFLSHNVPGGAFSGPGVSGEFFNPSQAGVGVHQVTYTVGQGGCRVVLRQAIAVHGSDENVVFHPVPDVCVNRPINLVDYISKHVGVFSGVGVQDNVFYPSLAGVGTHTISYVYQNLLGCEFLLTQTINVRDVIPEQVTFTTMPDVCQGAFSVRLSSFTNHPGTFSGTGVNGEFFNPSNVNPGTYTITFTYSSGACQGTIRRTITVIGREQVLFSPIQPVCKNSVIDLTQHVFPQGGVFSGAGVSGNNFNPGLAGAGTHVITYSFNNSLNCGSAIQREIRVLELMNPGTRFNALPDLCVNSSPINLTSHVESPATTGRFTGTGVEGTFFNPRVAGPGAWVITYKVGSAEACRETHVQTVVVHANDNVQFSPLPVACTPQEIDLGNFVSVQGGTFSGPGVVNGRFNPVSAGIGTHTIFYNFTSPRGCESLHAQTINVPQIIAPVSFNLPDEICQSAGVIQLNNHVNMAGGNFSGTGVSNNLFNPAVAKGGSHRITYTIGNESCRVEVVETITVIGMPDVTFNILPTVCFNEVVLLNEHVSHPGTFTGPGVSNNVFHPAVAGQGTHRIVFNYLQDGCRLEITRTITVRSLFNPNVSFAALPSVCINSTSLNLVSFVSEFIGTFSGPGVTGTMFSPGQAGIGTHEVKYVVGTGNCARELVQYITVHPTLNIEFLPLPVICNSMTINLNEFVSVQGGTFSGPGVINNLLHTGNLSLGNHIITYNHVSNNGCHVRVTQVLTVHSTAPLGSIVNFLALPDICAGSSPVDLREFVTTQGGIFSGQGVSGSSFNPSNLNTGEGVHRITYTLGQGICQIVLNQYIRVIPSKNIEFFPIGRVCNVDLIVLPEHVNYQGGVFSGRGVENNIFNPLLAGEGVHRITYTYNDGLCQVRVTQNLEVLNTRELRINVDRSVVQSSALVRFWSEGFPIQNYRWEFGDGGHSFQKEPFHYYYHLGDFDVTLFYEDLHGCKHVLKKEDFITVNPFTGGLKSVIVINDKNAIVGFHHKEQKPDNHMKVIVYPNPFTNHISVSNLLFDKINQIVIADTSGRIVYQDRVINQDSITISLDNLSSGIYFIKINEHVEKIIKN